ncbi:TetR/AcrR family transcriptional regulator [Halobacillus yeomjeoni]|uniref:TetR/AcrR family transcriptional regulator n=1 Tax=Halobacillus yeomjeoni TaxID=311194 RepID=A0A931HWM2_9BACI|nr:TetR/AcrR family transcriptional regulator [Halobacillus yeomjeoni]MBH0230706.1 TetR/AcrR family transcriptional regulator [Halobacillus yeomjeoni]
MDTKRRIIESALAEFGYEGFQGASIAKIAKQSGIAKSSVYSHFSSKEELYVAVLDGIVSFCRNLMERYEDDTQEFHARERLHHALINIYHTASRQRPMILFWHKCLMSPPEVIEHKVREKTEIINHLFRSYYQSIIESGIEKKEINSPFTSNQLASMFQGLVQSMLLGQVMDKETPADEMLNHLFTYYWNGIHPSFVAWTSTNLVKEL